MAVPRKAPNVPSYCQPLSARAPVGSVVLAVGSPVRNRIMPSADAANHHIATAMSETPARPGKKKCLPRFIAEAALVEVEQHITSRNTLLDARRLTRQL